MLITEREIPVVQLLGKKQQQVSFTIHLSQLDELTKLVKFTI